MASCCRQRRKRTEPLPESAEFKLLTSEHVRDVQELIKEREQREKENKRKRKLARELRKRFEAGEATEQDHENADRLSRLSFDDSIDLEEAAKNEEDAKKDKENKRIEKQGPNKRMEAGKKLSPKYAADIQKHLMGQPLIDIDPFYKEKEVFIVIGKDLSLNRFSAHRGLFCLSPFNPVRRVALLTLVHPLFNLVVMLTIITNCVFMAMGDENDQVEYVFTAIYTFEFLIKMLARGMVLSQFTYLRDAWNWLDFLVIMLAYVMLIVDKLGSAEGSDALGNVAALRTFRVLRALKTVAVVPGLKTIVGALMEAVIKMRDVGILTVFMLSIFALVGLQLYTGSLHRKCVLDYPANNSEFTLEQWKSIRGNWLNVSNENHRICGDGFGAGKCPEGFECMSRVGDNPNFGYTSWDNFGSCMLNSFRIMTQDFWENIYFITIRASGTLHFFFFVLFILLCSFYLINLILAIVAMAYNEQQERDRSELEAEENEKKESDEAAEALKAADAAEDQEEQDRHMREACAHVRNMNASRSPSRVPSLEKMLTPKPFVAVDRVSLRTDFDMDDPERNVMANCNKLSLSLPGSPTQPRRANSMHDLLFSIHHQGVSGQLHGPVVEKQRNRRPRPSLGNTSLGIDNPLPYADDSQAVTPSSVDGPTIFDYAHLDTNGTSHFCRALRASLNSRASRASVRSRSSLRATPSNIPNRALNYHVTDDQNNIPAVYVSGVNSQKKKIENEMLPQNDTPNQYSSLISLDSNTALRNNINMKGVHDIREMMDITSRARTIDEQNISKTELLKARFKQIFCSWSCCPCFLVTQKYLDLFISDAFMEVFIMICILCNTTFMAMEHHGQSEALTDILEIGNYFFTAVFTLECVFKLLAMGPPKYFREAWNSFDFAVVFFSLVELYQSLSSPTGGGGGGLSVLRSFRLLRVLKLAKSWQTLNSLMMIVAKSLGDLGNLTIILGIVIFIFAVMGAQLFSETYDQMADVFVEEGIPEWNIVGRIPRWNFKNFLHALMIVFRILCGEWIESMWNCMRTKQEYICVPFFLLSFIIGNLVVLNLFLVLLLSSFSADALDKKGDDDEVDKITEAKGRIVRFFKYMKKAICNKCCGLRQRRACKQITNSASQEMAVIKATGNGTNGVLTTSEYKDGLLDDTDGLSNSKTVTLIPLLVDYDDQPERETSIEKIAKFSASSCSSLDDAEALVPRSDSESRNPELTEVEVEYETLPSACCCPIVTAKCGEVPDSPLMRKFWALRCFAYRLVEHKYFESFIIICILMSSMSLALEDIYLKDRKILSLILNYMDKIFSGIFICEMLIKWLAFGYHKYFTDAWCWLDFVIVGISIVGLIMESSGMGSMSAFKAMRTLRALRPLRAVSRWEGMRVVVNALIQAVPSISNVLLVIMIFWLIFAIMGVNFFSGKFSKCVDAEGRFLHVYYRNTNMSIPDYNFVKDVLGVDTKQDCLNKAESMGYSWVNSKINFDNVPSAYLALLQVATYKGWIEIMADATDAREVDQNPIYENQDTFYLYFVMFIVFGSFFTLNLFIGVIIENFNAQKKKAGGSLEMFMTDDQKKYYNAMKKLSSSGPAKATPRPKWAPQAAIFDFTMNQKFDVAIMIFIMLNMVTMCAEYSNQPDEYTEILGYVNIVFIVVFTLEAVLKLIALRHYYFTFPWNVFDFVVVLFSILGLAFQDSIEKVLNLSPTVLRVVRVFRVGRVLRLVKSAKGIRTLLFSLLVSLPALFNIGLLLFLVMFIYATFGMAFFAYIQKAAGVDEVFNFETFFRALITLFQCTTSAGWSGVLAAITNEDGCDKNKKPSDCGHPALGMAYMVSYLLFTFLVIINMYIAVILENFSQATEDVQQGITQDDIEMYYELWGTYDPKASKYIPVDKLFDLVDELEDPLRVAKPNYFRLVMTDIPVCEGDKIHCSDILDMLTRLFLKQESDPAADENMPQTDTKEKYGEDYKPVYGLLERQRHKWAARFIWRRYLAYRAAKGNSIPNAANNPATANRLTVENELKLSDLDTTDKSKEKKDKNTKRSNSKNEMALGKS